MLRVAHHALKAARLDPLRRAYLLEAVGHLAWARLELSRRQPQHLLERLQRQEPEFARPSEGVDLELLSWGIRAGGAGVPWRSDCLVQSLAADRWLGRLGVAHDFRIGVKVAETGRFLAHAWIEVDGVVITGGDDVEYYRVLTSS